jgi:hypothetical protein
MHHSDVDPAILAVIIRREAFRRVRNQCARNLIGRDPLGW